MDERGIDLTLFSPRASAMAHHVGDDRSARSGPACRNDLVHRVVTLLPDRFAGVCQLPAVARRADRTVDRELRRCVEELGFVGCNLNPDPSGGHWTAPPLTDRSWYPFYEAMIELDVPAMVHVSASANPNFHATGAHYLNADTTAFMQFLQSDLFARPARAAIRDPARRGSGALPLGPLPGAGRHARQAASRTSTSCANVFFDTCVYHQPGIDLLFEVIDVDNILFGSEMIGAVRGIDHRTGHHFDDTRRYIDATSASDADAPEGLRGTTPAASTRAWTGPCAPGTVDTLFRNRLRN